MDAPTQAALESLAGGPVRWIQQGRTPVARGARGILRLAPMAVIDAEEAGKQWLLANLPELADLVPPTLARRDLADRSVLLEADLGEPDGGQVVPVFPPGNPQTHTAPLRDLLLLVDPPGGVNITPLLRALRQQPESLPFRPRASLIERALSQPLTVTLTRGPAHGAITPARLLEGGLCHWRRCGPDRIQQADLAAIGALDDPAVALCALKWGWRFDPLRAADALVALGVIEDTSGPVTLAVTAHPGLSADDLATLLGCVPGAVSRAAAAAALGRARGLVVGGARLTVTATPPVAPRSVPGFRQPRDRDPRRLFDRFHQGIQLDDDARASLTPQQAAEDIAARLRAGTIVDGFCGAGGNAIAFARAGRRVIAIDTRPDRLAQAHHNAGIYGVADRITFLRGDFFALSPPADACFLDPPWAAGDALLQRAWAHGRARYSRGMIKLPRTFPVPTDQPISVSFTPEGFPAFLTLQW
jgi:hypothetical protein